MDEEILKKKAKYSEYVINIVNTSEISLLMISKKRGDNYNFLYGING